MSTGTMSPDERTDRDRFAYCDAPRGRFVWVEAPGVEPRIAMSRARSHLPDEGVGRRRVVFGVDALDEKLRIWDHGLDDYVVEAIKGDMLGAAGPDLDMADIRFAERTGDMLWFTCAIPSASDLGRFAIPVRSYRHRAADPPSIAIDYPNLASDWLVDIRAGGIRPPSRRPQLSRTGG